MLIFIMDVCRFYLYNKGWNHKKKLTRFNKNLVQGSLKIINIGFELLYYV